MDVTVENAVSSALALQQAQLMQNAQHLMLRKTLDAQASTVASLVQAMPKLSTEGLVGRNLHAVA